jgi:hypothetical protein
MDDKTAKNDVTGDSIISKPPSKAYSDNYDRIFMGNKKPKEPMTKESNRDHGGRTRWEY